MLNDNNKLRDYGAVLDEKYGHPGTPDHDRFINEAESFFSGRMLRDTRRGVHMTQSELAERLNVTKSYISRVENGLITPSVTMFYRIIGALGLKVEIVSPLPAM